jgi:hypothetical protein
MVDKDHYGLGYSAEEDRRLAMLAARIAGPEGFVLGIDRTESFIETARWQARWTRKRRLPSKRK